MPKSRETDDSCISASPPTTSTPSPKDCKSREHALGPDYGRPSGAGLPAGLEICVELHPLGRRSPQGTPLKSPAPEALAALAQTFGWGRHPLLGSPAQAPFWDPTPPINLGLGGMPAPPSRFTASTGQLSLAGDTWQFGHAPCRQRQGKGLFLECLPGLRRPGAVLRPIPARRFSRRQRQAFRLRSTLSPRKFSVSPSLPSASL